MPSAKPAILRRCTRRAAMVALSRRATTDQAVSPLLRFPVQLSSPLLARTVLAQGIQERIPRQGNSGTPAATHAGPARSTTVPSAKPAILRRCTRRAAMVALSRRATTDQAVSPLLRFPVQLSSPLLARTVLAQGIQ